MICGVFAEWWTTPHDVKALIGKIQLLGVHLSDRGVDAEALESLCGAAHSIFGQIDAGIAPG
jgi:hypothetical protein